jgi:outer membrane protein OmpA-like peptidoglycan-associated protein
MILFILPAISFSQVGLKYVHLNFNMTGHFIAPNFREYINSYNLNGPKPPGVADYGFEIRSPYGLSFITGFGTSKGRVLFTLSYVGGTTKIDQFGDAPAPEWNKSVLYEYQNIGVGVMLHLLKSKNKSSEGFPRIDYQIGFGPEFNKLQYLDNSGPNNKYKTNNLGASTFIQYNFYTPYRGGVPIRVVYGINLRYHTSLNPVDFSSLQNDLNFHSSNKLSDRFKDLTFGVTLAFYSFDGGKGVKEIRKEKEKIKPTDFEINAFERNPKSMLELSAVDSVTGQLVNAKYDVVDEQKQRPVVLLEDKYLPRSVFKKMLTVYVTARAKGYFVREVAVEGYDTIKMFHEIKLRKIPPSPAGVFYFEQSSSKMTDDYTSLIDSVVSVLQRNQHMNIAIVGHTSADGNSRLNRTLSLKRAKVIRKLLLKSGVDEARTTVTGVGSSQPTVIRDTEEYQSINRRVEVFLRD